MTMSTSGSTSTLASGKENITKYTFFKILQSPFSLLQIKNVLVPNNLQMAVNPIIGLILKSIKGVISHS